MAWKPLPPGMERVLERLRDSPVAQRTGRIEGVMIKTFLKHADQRGYFIEQLKRGDLDDHGRPFLAEAPFAQMSRSLAYGVVEIRLSSSSLPLARAPVGLLGYRGR